jgi:hypothetical protein
MIIRGIKFRAVTEQGDFGYAFTFSRNLTIIRAGNSGGKSTLVNSLLYALGMEEIVGGKGERFLPYTVKDYIEHQGAKVLISSSEVLLEIENRAGHVVTVRRAIKDEIRDTKLVEVYPVSHIKNGADLGKAKPTYLHDSGGAQSKEGFHNFLESFLQLNLPKVPRTGGPDAKLYLQTIFAALAIEQKRGWTDYIANIPFYGIRDARTRVAEFLLGLNVFETSAVRNRLNSESVEIDSIWRRTVEELKSATHRFGFVVEGVPAVPSITFERQSAQVKRVGTTSTQMHEYVVHLNDEYNSLKLRAQNSGRAPGIETVQDVEKISGELQQLSVLHERSTSELNISRASLREYENLLIETSEDLEKNKSAAKLRRFGAAADIELAMGRCPTCHQTLEDNLLSNAASGPQMDLAMNIAYLESQSRMLKRQVAGLIENINNEEVRTSELATRLARKHDYLAALRAGVSSGASESKALIRRQVQIEMEVAGLDGLSRTFESILGQLEKLVSRFIVNQSARKLLPHSVYSTEDESRIRAFEINFRANAGSFGYKSATISDIEISRENLVPGLSQLELREIIKKPDPRKSDIKADSSASDFVRLIWSYLLALYQTSAHRDFSGHHPGILILDEPGQHAMRVESQHALLQLVAGERGLQCIVAASFDELETVFEEATEGVSYKLIEWEGKLIRPLGTIDD